MAISGNSPLTIDFTDTSTGEPTSWAWQFPGGTPTTSNEQNPTVIFTDEGEYNVILIASNSNGSGPPVADVVIVLPTEEDQPPEQFTLTVNTGAGGIAGIGSAYGPSSGVYEEGTVKTVVAQPNDLYDFSGWTGAGTGTGTNRTVTMNGNRTVNAGFTFNPGCFITGTLIQVPSGIKSIEDIKVGDIVKSFDVGTSSIVDSKVTKTYVHTDRYYMILNGTIKTTSVHPFYSDGKWIEAGDLSIGDKILHVDGLEHTIDSIELSDEPVTVYNFEVDGTHNYFAEGYLVHNK